MTFDRYGAVLILDGKTGMRRARIIASSPALSQWLSDHPLKNAPDAPLWTMFTEREKIKPVSYAAMRKVIQEAARNAEPPIKKRVHPHLFRHSRATDLANIMTERQMESYLGWTPGSRMPSVYVHLSGKEIDPVLLRSQGISVEEQKSEPSLKLTKCPRCRENNSPGVRFCRRCGSPVDTKTAIEMEEARTKIDSIMDILFEDEEFRKVLKMKIASLS